MGKTRRELCGCAAGMVLALLLATCVSAADANATPGANLTAPAVWEQTYGGLENETLLSLLTSPGGYVLVGAGERNGTELYLVRTDANGTAGEESRAPFGGLPGGEPAMAERTADGGVVVTGETGTGDVALVRLAPTGRQLWSRAYAIGSGRDTGDAVRAASDGGFLVAGTTALPGGGSPALLLLKVGEDGGEVWRRNIPLGAGTLGVADLLATPGGYLVVGSTDAGRAGALEILLVRVSSGGNREWQRTYAFGSERAEGVGLAPSPDGGWVLLGNANATGSSAPVLVKVDTAGNEQWRRRLAPAGSPAWGYALAPAGTDGYAVAGAVGAPEGTRSWVARLDRGGAESWNRTFAIGNGPSQARAVTTGARNALVVAGDASRTPEALYDLYLAQVAPLTVAPNATPTANVTPTANATVDATPTATATSTPGTTAPATTQAPLALPVCLAALAGAALVAAARRR